MTEVIQIILNHSPLNRLVLRYKAVPNVYQTPLGVFNGVIPTIPVLLALFVQKYAQLHSITEAQESQSIHVDRVQQALDSMHREVINGNNQQREKARARHNF